jgi:hypothetical protein
MNGAPGREAISQWFDEAKGMVGITHMLVVCDKFDYSDSPVFVSHLEAVQEVIDEYNSQAMSKVMEVYSMALDKESQLNEYRAYHPEESQGDMNAKELLHKFTHEGLPAHLLLNSKWVEEPGDPPADHEARIEIRSLKDHELQNREIGKEDWVIPPRGDEEDEQIEHMLVEIWFEGVKAALGWVADTYNVPKDPGGK